MSVNIRKNGVWTNITFDLAPFAVGGTWSDETSNRLYRDTGDNDIEQAKRIYTNNSGDIMLIRAVPGIDRIARNLTAGQVSGSYAIAYVDDVEVARFRDNGTASSEEIRFELQFFVPNYSEYYVKVFKKNHDQSQSWQGDDSNGDPFVETFEWYEFTFQ
jgi:hypothetical protein